MTSVLIVQPDAADPPERLQMWLESERCNTSVVRPYLGERIPPELEADALVVLGGDMSAHDVMDHPWLADVKSLLVQAVSVERPTLGVCLGGQLLATALGGEVQRGSAGMEAGVVAVHPRADAAHDLLLANLPWPLQMITMHRDAITELPPQSVWLADSKPYAVQAFRVGPVAWGVQFHPEVSPTTYASWTTYIGDTGEALQRVIDGVPHVDAHDHDISRSAEALVRQFARIAATWGIKSALS